MLLRKSGHTAIRRDGSSIGPAQEQLDFTLLAHGKAAVPSLDQERTAQHQAARRAGESQIVLGRVVEPPDTNYVLLHTR